MGIEMNGLLARKIGMTRVYDSDGMQIPVTVLEVGPCVVIQRKTTDRDGYDAIQCGFIDKAERLVTGPMLGHFKKAGVSPRRRILEFKQEAGEDIKVGETITVAIFKNVKYVDISGITKGRGYQGVVKRWGFGGGPAGHGGHSVRRPGSIGQKALPARVMKGKKMGGHMGVERITTQNIKVVNVIPEENAMLVMGAVPGPVGAVVEVRKALKKAGLKS